MEKYTWKLNCICELFLMKIAQLSLKNIRLHGSFRIKFKFNITQ